MVFVTQAGYYFIYVIQVAEAREEMKERLIANLPDSMLEDFVLEDHASSISWQEEGKEFYLNNELYDVARTKIINGKTHLFCMNDTRETGVLSDLKKALNNSGDNKNSKSTLKFQFPVYTINDVPVIISHPVQIRQFSFVLKPILHTAFLDVSAPPPKA